MALAPAIVLFCDHETDCGGAQLSLVELIGGLDRERYTPLLACSETGPLASRARDAGAEIHVVPMLFQGKLRKLLGLRRATGLVLTPAMSCTLWYRAVAWPWLGSKLWPGT